MRTLTAVLALMTASAALADDRPVRLATYNIHHGEGTDGKLDLERVAAVVRTADVVALQEVDVKFDGRSRFEDQADRLGKLLGGKVAFVGNLVIGDRRYGVALVSKFPIIETRHTLLPRSPGREKAEPRGLLEALLDVNGSRVRVLVTHLAHDSAADRRLQVDALRKSVAARGGPTLLLGDLNMRPDNPEYARLLEPASKGARPLLVDAWAVAGKGPGATIGLETRNPGRIDYILASPDLAGGLSEPRVDTETRASDHQPVFATLRLPTANRP